MLTRCNTLLFNLMMALSKSINQIISISILNKVNNNYYNANDKILKIDISTDTLVKEATESQ